MNVAAVALGVVMLGLSAFLLVWGFPKLPDRR
jgi:hypothetical protein